MALFTDLHLDFVEIGGLLLLLFFIGFDIFIYLYFWKPHEAAALEKQTKEAVDAFKMVKIPSTNLRYALDGALARIVKIEAIDKASDNGHYLKTLFTLPLIFTFTFTLVIYATNEYGEYFMFRKRSNHKPFIKHVPQNVAKVVLKNLYEAPVLEVHGA